jgi:hypothetical protein
VRRRLFLACALLALATTVQAQTLETGTAFNKTATSSGIVTITPGRTTVAGNLLVVGVISRDLGSCHVASVAANSGDNFTQVSGAEAVGPIYIADTWVKANATANAGTITVTMNANCIGVTIALAAQLWEVSGMATSTPLDVAAVVTASSAGTLVDTAIVTTTNGHDFISATVVETTTVPNLNGVHSGDPFTQNATNNDSVGMGTAYRIVSSTGSYKAQWDLSSSGALTSSVVSFKAAATSSGCKGLTLGVWSCDEF